MRPLEELLSTDSALPQVRAWIAEAKNHCVVLEPSESRANALLRTQVTTGSSMGALVYETGGVLIDQGWLRLLGSGHPQLQRSLPSWNEGKADGFYLIADDAAGGFFALNGGAFGEDIGCVHYWPPDSLDWEPIDLGYSQFLHWCLSADLEKFYSSLRWKNWRADVAAASADQCMSFYPPLWSKEGSAEGSHRRLVPAQEAFDVRQDFERKG
jgi:Protein of unknown function DUF2625